MENENEKVATNESVNDNTEDYIEAIKKLKASTVSKDDYEKLKKENKQLIDSLTNGETLNDAAAAAIKKPTMDELRNKAFNTNNATNLEIVQNILELRSAIIDQDGIDPFLPNSKAYTPEYQDALDAQNVADVLQQCVDAAEGDPNVFNAEWSRHISAGIPTHKKK